MKKIRVNVAGIDVGGEYHYVAAPDPKHEGRIVVNRFGSFTTNLKECVDWLKQCNIVSIAMEATGVYWTILYTMLEEAGIEVILVNPRDFKKMKDKKTDVCDAEYLQLYHSYSLLEGAVIPEKKVGELWISPGCVNNQLRGFSNLYTKNAKSTNWHEFTP